MAEQSMPTTGVVLAALDEFSANMKAYVSGLSQVETATTTSATATEKVTTATQKQAEAHKLGAEKMARYAMGASIVTGQLQQMGVSADKVMLPMTVLFTTMTEGFNPQGAILLGVGLLASKLVSVFTEAQRLREETDKLTASLVGMAATTGVQSQAERAAVARDLAAATKELVDAQVKLETANQHLADGEKGYIGNFNKAEAIRDQAAALKAVRDAQKRMVDDSTALAGGTDAATRAQQAYTDALHQRAQAESAAAAATKTRLAAENKDQQTQLDAVNAAAVAADDRISAQVKADSARRQKAVTAFVQASAAGFAKVTKDATDSAAAQATAESNAATESLAIRKAHIDATLELTAQLGQALGGMFAGEVGAAKAAAFVVLDVIKRQVEGAIGITAALNPLNLLKLAAVEAAFAAAKAGISSMGGGGSTAGAAPSTSPNYGGGASTQSYGYGGGYYYAPTAQSTPGATAPVIINFEQHVSGDVSPQTRAAVRHDVEDTLYRIGPEAARRAKALGKAAA